MAYVRPYEPGDAAVLAPLLRAADLREVQALTDRPVADVLEEGAELSVPSCSIIGNRGVIAGMFGVTPYHDFGRVWMLGSDELTQAPLKRQFLRECRLFLRTLEGMYPVLCNVIDERNTVHVRWLQWMGFTFIRRIPQHGIEHRPFLEFIKLCVTPSQ